MQELVSIIVPTHNEAADLDRAIRSATHSDNHFEVIVADGGSVDATLAVARANAARTIRAPRNRAAQLNAGAAAARGSILVFLHADSCLPAGSLAAIRTALAEPAVVGGAFTLQIGSARGGLRMIAWGTNLRSRLLGLPYGDQALFVRTSTFRRLEGFRPLAIMEDVDFVRRLRRTGRMSLIDMPVQTSARRWQRHGMLRTTFTNAAALALYKLGVPPHRIRRYYDSMLKSGANGHAS